jgi:hypothetical protein
MNGAYFVLTTSAKILEYQEIKEHTDRETFDKCHSLEVVADDQDSMICSPREQFHQIPNSDGARNPAGKVKL